MKQKAKRILKRLLYVLLGLILLAVVGIFGAIEYAKHRLFRDTPNTLAFVGELHTVPFEWSAHKSESYTEPHVAILIPVSVPELPNKFYMQFDTGSADTFIRPGVLKELKSHGVKIEVIENDEQTFIKELELNVAGNRVILSSGRIHGQNVPIDWDDPKAINVIGSFGADFLDQKICEIDFPAQEIRFHRDRPESLDELGEFTPFKFKGRRIMLPANIDGSDVKLFYDSGCSAFGLLTSKYHYDRLTDPNEKEIAYGANRFGESIPIHHKSSDLQIKLGSTDLSLKRISYAEMYNFLQSTVGRFVGGGFLGNKSLTEYTLIIDAKSNEFLVVKRSLSLTADRAATKHNSEQASPRPGTSANANSTNPLAEAGLVAGGSGTSDDDERVIEWIKTASIPLTPGQQDFGPFDKQAELAQVIGLGEATHGQHEAFELKRQLTMHLIRRHGYRVVAYEAGASSAVVCNAYILGKTDDREKAIAGLGMLVWQVEENGLLLDDLKAWNQLASPADRVRFIGCDAQNGKAVMKRLTVLLGENNSDEIEKLNGLRQRLDGAMQQAMQGDKTSLEKLLADSQSICEEIRQLAAKQLLDVSKVDLRLKEFSANLGLYSAPGMRDKAMADLLLAQIDLTNPQEKCVFWGHNGHVQRGQLVLQGGSVPAMGGHLAKSLGDKYYAIGFAFGQGEFQANVQDEKNKWRFRRYLHSAAPQGSMGALFAAATKTDFILDFRSAPKVAEVENWLNSAQSFRSWGGYNVPEDFDDSKARPLPQCAPGKNYDGIAFHHRTTAAQPLNVDLILEKSTAARDGKE